MRSMGGGFVIWRRVGLRGGLATCRTTVPGACRSARSGSTCMFGCSVLRVQRRRRPRTTGIGNNPTAEDRAGCGSSRPTGNGCPKGDAL